MRISGERPLRRGCPNPRGGGGAWPPGVPRQDFWLFDSRALVLMHYDAHGALVTTELTTHPEPVAEALRAKDEAWTAAVPFEDYSARFDTRMLPVRDEPLERQVDHMSGSTETLVQARDIHGDLDFYAAGSEPTLVPRRLPATGGLFVDRRRRFAELDARLPRNGAQGTEPSIVQVTGGPGGGKSEPTYRWGHRAEEHFPDGTLYVDLGAYGTTPNGGSRAPWTRVSTSSVPVPALLAGLSPERARTLLSRLA